MSSNFFPATSVMMIFLLGKNAGEKFKNSELKHFPKVTKYFQTIVLTLSKQ